VINLNGGYFSIGKMSKISDVSIDTIRYYDDLGLLKPAYVADDTGYRYYADKQVEELEKIRELKSFGFSLRDIKKITLSDDMPLDGLYKNRYYSLIKEKEKLQAKIDLLAQKIKENEEVSLMKKRILIVDDAVFMRMMLRDIFEKKGFEVVGEATDGLECLEMYINLKPDLVVLDVTMPRQDGISTLKLLKEFDENANVIMLSAQGRVEVIAESLILGAKSFVVKPFQADMLLSKIIETFMSEENPVNKTFLSFFVENASLFDNNILSQEMTDALIDFSRVVDENNDVSAEFIETIKSGSNGFSDMVKGLEKIAKSQGKNIDLNSLFDGFYYSSTEDKKETKTLLQELVKGQEKMTVLLEKLVNTNSNLKR